jgi:hypothetical protein
MRKFQNLVLSEPPMSNKGRKSSNITSRLCVKYKDENDGKRYYGCVASKCDWLQHGNAANDRILKHATTCKHLLPDDQQFAINQSANDSLGERIAISDEKKAAQNVPAPSLAEFSFASTHMAPKGPKLKSGSIEADCTNAGREELKQRLDFAIMKVICVGGMSPYMVDKPCWKEMWEVGNPRYKPTPSTMFVDTHIPKEEARIHKKTIEILRGYDNNTLTFDGNDTRARDSVYTTHYTTPDRRTFLFRGYEATDEHHSGEWVKDILVEVTWLEIPTILPYD